MKKNKNSFPNQSMPHGGTCDESKENFMNLPSKREGPSQQSMPWALHISMHNLCLVTRPVWTCCDLPTNCLHLRCKQPTVGVCTGLVPHKRRSKLQAQCTRLQLHPMPAVMGMKLGGLFSQTHHTSLPPHHHWMKYYEYHAQQALPPWPSQGMT